MRKMNPQKIVIAMPTEDEFMPSISRWGHEYVWTHKEVYFIHVVRKDIYVHEMGVDEIPGKVEQENIKKQLLDFIKNKAGEMMPLQAFKKKHQFLWILELIFTFARKSDFFKTEA